MPASLLFPWPVVIPSWRSAEATVAALLNQGVSENGCNSFRTVFWLLFFRKKSNKKLNDVEEP
jgi:hypothetical protein